MNLKEKIQGDFKEAFKAREEIKVSVLKMLNAAIANAEIEKRTKLSKVGESDIETKSRLNDDEIIQVLSREAKKRKEAVEAYEKSGRTESAEKEKEELKILSSYLPEQLSEDEIRAMAKKAIEQAGALGAKDFGKVMGVLSKETKGRADGAVISRIVKELLG